MDWLISFIQEHWAGIMATVTTAGLGGFGIKSLVNRNKLIVDFGNVNGVLKEIKKGNEAVGKIIFDSMGKLENRVETLISENKEVKETNSLLVDLVVLTLSVANIPLAEKEKFHSALLNIGSVNNNILLALKDNIDNVRKRKKENEVDNKELDNLIETVDV